MTTIQNNILLKGHDFEFINLTRIHPPEDINKIYFDDRKQTALVKSIKENGLLQNLIVTQINTGDKNTQDIFRLIAGRRRFAAIKTLVHENYIAPHSSVPCLITNPNTDTHDICLMANFNHIATDKPNNKPQP